MIQTDICIIGAGPVGLFAVFEAGLLKMKCHLVDYLPVPGGQCAEIYPKKPIYDIPGHPSILAGDLVHNLMEQIAPFHPTFTLGERAEQIEKKEDGKFLITTSLGTKIEAPILCLAAGLGCFEPRKPEIAGIEQYEGKGLDYIVRDPETLRGKRVVIAGGGDSALDWALNLSPLVTELTLVHRSGEFRAAPDSVQKAFTLAETGKIRIMTNANITELHGDHTLTSVTISSKDGSSTEVECDFFLPLFGLSPKLGPIADWGLSIEKNAVKVNTLDYSTNIPGIYAIGDINDYEGKMKLILCGFHEAALMAQSAYKRLNPEKRFVMKYTTVTGITPMSGA
ncbi:MAG: NAD(P)/FAD-dependent oxidoreductase [Ignavibacteria bacterium]|jgi:thioredoxin reductase (NADPH)|nr:NAD(P)/FAD-dependent oxidoreductase [Ignavibacteria bacterium]